MFKEVTLQSGEIVKVYPVPHFAVVAAQATVKLPTPPLATVKSAAGHEEQYLDQSADSSAYQAYVRERAAAERAAADARTEFILLSALRDVVAPADDDWYELVEYAGIKRREGKQGRRLDFIQYALLMPSDATAVLNAVNELSYPSEERVAAKMESFRDNGSGAGNGAPAPGHPDQG